MKTLYYIIGGVVCIGLIIAAMDAAMTLGLSIYIAHTNTIRGQELAQQQQGASTADSTQQQNRQRWVMSSWGDAELAEKKRDDDELSGKLPSLFADPGGYGTEDNWLATMISREIAEMSYFAAHPSAAVPDLKVRAQFDPTARQVQAKIDGFGTATISVDLKPKFAWDPTGYAPLAGQLLGTTPGMAAIPVTDGNDVLTHLLNLTGPELATEDVRLSANLQAHPTSWQDHEAAALLLMALALRDVGGLDRIKDDMAGLGSPLPALDGHARFCQGKVVLPVCGAVWNSLRDKPRGIHCGGESATPAAVQHAGAG